MTRYLISFDDGAMDFIPEEEMPTSPMPPTRWSGRPRTPGYGCSPGVCIPRRGRPERGGHRWDGHRRRGEQGVHRRSHDPRRAVTRGGAAVGRQDRLRVPVCQEVREFGADPAVEKLIGCVGLVVYPTLTRFTRSPGPVFANDA